LPRFGKKARSSSGCRFALNCSHRTARTLSIRHLRVVPILVTMLPQAEAVARASGVAGHVLDFILDGGM
jgi:hypothetical protein